MDASAANAAEGTARPVVVSGSFDDVRSPDVRFLQEAARLGRLHVRLWSDGLVATVCRRPPAFPEAERRFVVEAIRCVDGVSVVDDVESSLDPIDGAPPEVLVTRPAEGDAALAEACARRSTKRIVIDPATLVGFPDWAVADPAPDARRVIVTGCFDWLHSGHVEFFNEGAALGELYVVVGSDRNVRLLKGDGHPMHDEDERRYMVGAVRSVHRALVSTGSGWMDAAPEIAAVAPHIYLVNEDGDKPEKREFCRANGLEYVVLSRTPHPGLPKRSSTDLRGF